MSPIDDYLKSATPSQQKELQRIRRIVKSIVPDAEETISYGIPTLKYRGKYLFYFAAYKNHMGVYGGVEAVRHKLKDYKTRKGTIQFTEDKPLSEEIIREMTLNRKTQIEST